MYRSFSGKFAFLFTLFLLLGTLLSPYQAVFAQVTLSGSGVTGNPKLFYRGLGSSSPVGAKLYGTLWASGWFDLVSDPKSAEYIIDGKEEGESLSLSVKNGAGLEMFGVAVQGKSDEAVYGAVDKVLNKLFGIDGICRSKIAFSAETGRGRKELYICDIDGSNIKKVTSNGSLNIEPSWHPSGKALLFNQYLTSSSPLVEYDFLRNRSRVLSGQRGINSGKVSHSGRKLALVVTVGSQVDLFVRDYEGGGVVRLTNDRANEASPCWSPDDSRICFVSDRTGRPKLYIVSASGGKAERVRGTSGSECVAPAWSEDNKLAYTAKLGGYVLKVVDLAKSMGFPAPKNPDNSYISETLSAQGEGPSWAPDNRHMVLSSGGKIVVVDTRTGKSRVLIKGKSRCNGASWSPLMR
ncbi:MAG: PD40 domain-containing protein [Lentisphaeria bacterium]|nr:PD40 domain-containing protein [Lentisphaeria bacterium]